MIKEVKTENNEINITLVFTKNDFILLKNLKEKGYLEFKDGNSYILDNLYDYGLVTSDVDAWHCTFILTKLGQSIVEKMIF